MYLMLPVILWISCDFVVQMLVNGSVSAIYVGVFPHMEKGVRCSSTSLAMFMTV
jgi:hypothetical protein